MRFDQQNMEHFLRLARRGRQTNASAGEERSARLLVAILDDAAGLDANAIHGAADFLRLLALDFTLANKLAGNEGKVAS
jgi:hypothetical protein